MKSALILTTYKRLDLLSPMINSLNSQTEQDFLLYIIHNDPSTKTKFLEIISQYHNQNKLEYKIYNNSLMSFRRHMDAAKLAHRGYKAIMMLDDDIRIPNNYVEACISQFEDNTYKSSHAFSFQVSPLIYSDRTQHYKAVFPNSLHYCGPGASIIDSSLFLVYGFFDKEIVYKHYMFDDIWISAFVLKNGWRMDYLDSGATIGCPDEFAMYSTVAKPSKKQEFLDLLINKGFYQELSMLK